MGYCTMELPRILMVCIDWGSLTFIFIHPCGISVSSPILATQAFCNGGKMMSIQILAPGTALL